MAHAVTPHVCTISGQHRCSGKECGDDSKGEREVGECDKVRGQRGRRRGWPAGSRAWYGCQ